MLQWIGGACYCKLQRFFFQAFYAGEIISSAAIKDGDAVAHRRPQYMLEVVRAPLFQRDLLANDEWLFDKESHRAHA